MAALKFRLTAAVLCIASMLCLAWETEGITQFCTTNPANSVCTSGEADGGYSSKNSSSWLQLLTVSFHQLSSFVCLVSKH
jgi:hypothetical protein